MPWFRCLIHGYNFVIAGESEHEYKGFYTTRFVKADNPEQAEKVGLKLIRSNEFLKDENIKKQSPRARVEFEEIAQLKGKPPKVGIWPFRRHVAGGFVFYESDEEK